MSVNDQKIFKRQEEIPWFSQEKISTVKVAIIGVGGIGCNVAMLLTRLGINQISLIDNDVIEASNLNRQSLYSQKDIGKKKVVVARATLEDLHDLGTKIISYDYDIFQDWRKTVEIIKDCEFVLNGLDQPEIKRTLIGILCLKLEKPMIYSGTDPHSGYSGMVLYQASEDTLACHECLQAILNSVENQELVQKYSLKNILTFDTIDWREFEKKDFKQLKGGATMLPTAMLSSVLAVNVLIQAVHDFEPPERIIFDMFGNNVESYKVDKREDCLVCGG